MPIGFIVKALSGFYYVMPEQTTTDRDLTLVQCRGKGILRKHNTPPLVGDRVMYHMTENGEGMVDTILPRSSELVRPPIANVELAVLVFSLNEPALNLQLLDKFLVHVEHARLKTLICFTKEDLLTTILKTDAAHRFQLYEQIGYDVITTSAFTGRGVCAVLDKLQGKISVFSGQSGVGKSSLLNAMLPHLKLETDVISLKLGRGKHTTRHVELLSLHNGGWVADTPGFSQMDFMQLEAEQLSECFKEFRMFAGGCKFRGCLHRNEPNCQVIKAVNDGQIAESRYKHYLQFLTEIMQRKRRY